MAQSLTRAELESVIGAAVRAPSILNTQPWRFHAREDVIDVWADPARALTHLDPQGRELLLSCGAALLNLRLALARLGRVATVQLLPDADQPDWVARIEVDGGHPTSDSEVRLFDAIEDRRASREPFTDVEVPEEVVAALAGAAEEEGARLDVPPRWHRAALAGLVHDADRRQLDDPDVVLDIRAWTGAAAPADAGIPIQELGPRPSDSTALVRDFAAGAPVAGREEADFGPVGLLLVLLTAHDSPIDRVAAGQALERVWLEATAAGVSMTLLTQPVEVPHLRPWLRDPSAPWGWPQALLRLGYGPRPPRTSRRPVDEVLTQE